MLRLSRGLLLLPCSLLPGLPGLAGLSAQEQPSLAGLGELSFPTSARAEATQAWFLRGMLLLHSFEYDDAAEAFRAARQREPQLAIAHWGEAMTHYRPIWRQEDVDAAQAVLAGLAPTAAGRRALCGSDVERGLLGAAEVLFGPGRRPERWTGYSEAMQALSARHPHDVEIGALCCLSILGTSLDGRDMRTYMRAAAVGEHFYRREPQHPGLLHYLIHCYDDPVHAPLGLRMAKSYDRVAPAAAHALHMPSHIYLALGMWPETVAANVRSVAAADARRAAKGLDADERGWHSFLWLGYGHLQLGDFAAARALLEEAARYVDDHPQSRRILEHFCQLRMLFAVDTRAFDDVLVVREVDRGMLGGWHRANADWVRGRVALARGDAAAATAIAEELAASVPATMPAASAADAATCCAPAGRYGTSRQSALAASVAACALRAAVAEHRGELAAAEAALREAAGQAVEMDLDFGPPEAVPAHEELAAFLHRTGRAAEAAESWRTALLRAPGRLRAVQGLAEAGGAAGAAGGDR